MSDYSRQARWARKHLTTLGVRVTVEEAAAWRRACSRLGLGCTNAALRRYVAEVCRRAGTAPTRMAARTQMGWTCAAARDHGPCPRDMYDLDRPTYPAGAGSWEDCAGCPARRRAEV